MPETLTIGGTDFVIAYDDKPAPRTFNARARSKRAANRWLVYCSGHLRDCLPSRDDAIARCADLAAEFARNS